MRCRIGVVVSQLIWLGLGGLLALGGCATVVKGSSQNVTVITDPPGASCVFRRGGVNIGVINPTPGTLAIDKSSVAIDVRCTKQGYAEAAGSVGSHFQAMTFGNVIFGGLIGIAVDASSGAASEYEPEFTLTLVPLVFPGRAERDAFFAERKANFVAQSRMVKERIAANCSGEICDRQIKLADEQERAGLARIEAEYQSSRIGS